MIDLEKLKKVLEPVINEREDAVDIIEQITGLDEEVGGFTQEDLDAKDKEWSDRVKKMFFEGERDETNINDGGNPNNEEIEVTPSLDELLNGDC